MPISWSESNRFIPRTVVRPLQSFMHTEAAGGIVMLFAAIVALVWANSPWSDSYFDLIHTHLNIELGGLLHLDLTIEEWINDGLMVVFFFVVGLEIKRELVVGELRDPKAAALPAVAALGGMVVPALIYLAFNAGEPTSGGWGIPMATDIAFAVGIVSLVGNRIPVAAKLFLLALAIVDDLGAIAVIALFYTDSLSFGWLLVAFAALVGAAVLKRGQVRSLAPYIALGVVAWFAMHESGVHATITGVVMGLLAPVRPFYDPTKFRERAVPLIDKIDSYYGDVVEPGVEHEKADAYLREVKRLATESESVLDRIEHALHQWSSFVIIPVFALANAGVKITGDMLSGALSEPVVLGIALGLVVGKTIGVFGATWLAVKTGIGRLPRYTSWRDITGLAMAAGIGFTVALFVANLSFPVGEEALEAGEAVITGAGGVPELDYAKVGILAGSLIAGIISYALLRISPMTPPEGIEDGVASMVPEPREPETASA